MTVAPVLPTPSVAAADVPVRRPIDGSRIALWLIAVGAVVGSVWGLRRVGLSVFEIIDGWPETQNLLERMWPPAFAAEDRGAITRAIFDTLFMAYAGTVIGVVLSVPLSFLAARNVVTFAPVRMAARAVIVFTRAVPTLVFALVFVRVYGIGVIPGILAIGIHSVGMIGKLLSEAIEDIDVGPREGVVSTGAGRFQELATGIWSQIIPAVISVSLYRLEINFRGAPVLGFVGAGGIGLIIRGYQGNLRYPELIGVTLLIIVLVIVMEVVSSITRKAILGDTTATGKARSGDFLDRETPIDMEVLSSNALSRVKERASSADESVLDVAPGGDDIDLRDTPPSEVSLSQPWTRERIRLTIAGWTAAVLLVLSFIVPDISIPEFFTAIGNLPEILWRLVPKDMTWLTERVVSDLIETVAIGFAATSLSLLVAVPLSFLAARNTSPNSWTYRFSRLLALLVRASPELIVAVIFVAAIGLGPAAGTLALTIGLIGFSTKLMADNIEEVAEGPRDGVFATGASRIQEVGTGVAPQASPALLGNMLYLLDISLRSSTVLGIVGAGGIGFLLNNAAKTLKFEVMGGIILSIFVIVYLIELLSTWVRGRVL